MEVDSPKQAGSIRPGSKRTYTGELASAHTPQTPDASHHTAQHLISRVFQVTFSVSAQPARVAWGGALGWVAMVRKNVTSTAICGAEVIFSR